MNNIFCLRNKSERKETKKVFPKKEKTFLLKVSY